MQHNLCKTVDPDLLEDYEPSGNYTYDDYELYDDYDQYAYPGPVTVSNDVTVSSDSPDCDLFYLDCDFGDLEAALHLDKGMFSQLQFEIQRVYFDLILLKHREDCLDTQSHLDLSVNERLYVYITSNYDVETQIGESLAENDEIHDGQCSFNLADNWDSQNYYGPDVPFNNSIRMVFDLTKW